MSEQGITSLFMLVMDLASALGVSRIHEMDGCWEYEWRGYVLAVNGHADEQRDSGGMEVPPYHAILSHVGWPVAMVTPRGGVVLSMTEAEVEGVLQAEISRVQGAAS